MQSVLCVFIKHLTQRSSWRRTESLSGVQINFKTYRDVIVGLPLNAMDSNKHLNKITHLTSYIKMAIIFWRYLLKTVFTNTILKISAEFFTHHTHFFFFFHVFLTIYIWGYFSIQLQCIHLEKKLHIIILNVKFILSQRANNKCTLFIYLLDICIPPFSL